MEAAWVRAHSVAARTLADMRRHDTTLAFLCTMPGCTSCAAYETDHFDAAVCEVRRRFGATCLLPWPCATSATKQIALATGVDDVPCVVVVPPRGPVHVLDAHALLVTSDKAAATAR